MITETYHTEQIITQQKSRIHSETKSEMIHIIIPAYNEQYSIIPLLNKITNQLDSFFPYRITVIDDGSSDNTANLVRQLGKSVTLQQNLHNSGKGTTMRRAIAKITPDEIVVFMDADGEHKASDISRMVLPIIQNKADLVIGSRFLSFDNNKKSYLKNGKKFGQIRMIGNYIFSLITSILFHQFISDTQSGFRAFRGYIGKHFLLNAEGFQIEMEMTVEALRHGIRIQEIPIDNGFCERPSYMNIIIDSLKIGLIILIKRFFSKYNIFQFLYRR